MKIAGFDSVASVVLSITDDASLAYLLINMVFHFIRENRISYFVNGKNLWIDRDNTIKLLRNELLSNDLKSLYKRYPDCPWVISSKRNYSESIKDLI